MRYVIIGGGIAGTTAAGELRKLDPEAEIAIISEEHHRLYSRVLLPLFMVDKVPRERVFLKKQAWYGEQGIEFLAGITVHKLDPINHFVGLSNGRELEYDKLLISTGGEVRSIYHDARGVCYFRTLDDADHIMQLINERGKQCRGGVYGGGFIACEFINLFKHFQIPTTISLRSEHFWTRSLEAEAGALINTHLESHGVEVQTNAELVGLTGDKELTGFVTSKGDHSCSILGIGIGMKADFSWISEAGVETGVGIKANEFLQTNISDIFTAGDVAEFFDPIIRRQVNIGNWMNAMSQGRTVAKSMVGDLTKFELVSSYATNALGLEMIFVGDVEKAAADKVHVVGSVIEGGVTQLFERNGQLVGGVMIGRNTDRPLITKLIQERASLADFLGDFVLRGL